jgi:glycerate dehydrogenase
MKAAFLDWSSLNGEELDRTCLDHLPVDWRYFPNISRPDLERLVHDHDLLITNKVVIDEDLLSMASGVRLICVAATGTNNVDLKAASRKQIPVCNVRGYASESVMQHVFMLMLNLSRRFIPYQQSLRDGEWQRSDYFCLLSHPIESLAGKTIGIVGYGELGRTVAEMARQFDMRVLIAKSLAGHDNAGRVELEDLLQQSDYVSLHCPLTEQTSNLIGEKELRLMKQDAFLINTARGGIVDEAALLNALEDRQIAGAAMDVLSEEPPASGHPLLEAKMSNLIITPHIAWGARQSRQKLLDKLAFNIQSWLDGKLINQVNEF